MKKAYTKPLFYSKDFKTGKIVTNSAVFAEAMNKKFAEIKETDLLSLADENGSLTDTLQKKEEL